MQKFDAVIFIGRFQPPTLAHTDIIKKALDISKKVIVIIGSAKKARSIMDPWTADERIEMLKSIAAIGSERIVFAGLENSAYDFSWWLSQVKKIAAANTRKEDKIGIIGHKKDFTSYYLNCFPKWDFIEMPSLCGAISATKIREALFENRELSDIPAQVSLRLKRWLLQNEEVFQNLKQEYEYIKNYKQMWKAAPFEPVFVTADAAVLCNDNILLIERKNLPGKNLYALPGGFLEQDESLLSCAIRELKEETSFEMYDDSLKKSLLLTKVFDAPDRDFIGRSITHVHVFLPKLNSLPQIKASDDAKTAFWLPLCELEDKREKFFGDHYKIIKNILKDGLCTENI